MNKTQRWKNKRYSGFNSRYSKNAAGRFPGKKKARVVRENPIANKITNRVIRRCESRFDNFPYKILR